MEQIVFAYITAGSVKEAKKIGNVLVNERLAACVNIFPYISSIYRWEGKIHHDREAILIAKTQKKYFKRLMQKVKSLHSYSCPCILQISVAAGSKEYIQWLTNETKAVKK